MSPYSDARYALWLHLSDTHKLNSVESELDEVVRLSVAVEEARKAEESVSAPFVLYSAKWSRGVAVWWRSDGKGYTTNLEDAGDYPEGEARRISAECQGDAIAIRRSVLANLKTRRVLDFGDSNNREDFQEIISKNGPSSATEGGR